MGSMKAKQNRGGRPTNPIDESTYAGRFAARLRMLREKAGITGEQMAEEITNAGYDCPKRTYYNWEAGTREPPLNSLPTIAKTLRVQVRTIFPSA